MKSLQKLLLPSNLKNKHTMEDRFFCFLDTERLLGELTQVSAIICSETKTDLKVIDHFNIYITPENKEESKEQILRFFYKYPNMIYVGNCVGMDTLLICKHLLDIATDDYLVSAYINDETMDTFKGYIDTLQDERHCKNIHIKKNLRCWLTDNDANAECPYILKCRNASIQHLLFGDDYICIDTSSPRIVGIFKHYLGLMSEYRDLESLKMGLNISTACIVNNIKDIFETDQPQVQWHDAIFDSTVMYTIQKFLKIATVSKRAYLDMRLSEFSNSIRTSLTDSENYDYIGIIDTCFNSTSVSSIGILILKRNTVGLRIVDVFNITNLNRLSNIELTNKLMEFIEKYPRTFYCGHNILHRLEILVDKLIGIDTDEVIHLNNDYYSKLKAWRSTYSQNSKDDLTTLLGEDCAIYSLNNLLKRQCYHYGYYIDITNLNTSLLLNRLGSMRQFDVLLGEGFSDNAISNCVRLLELLIECVEEEKDLILKVDSSGYITWEKHA